MKDIKKIIFVVFIIVLFIPIIVKSFKIIDEKPLNGVYIPTEEPKLTIKSWINGTFQPQQEKYLNENIGLHNTLVKINNQINFSLYLKSTAEKVVVGKDKYLFEINYIAATTGTDALDLKTINELSDKAKQAQDLLESRGIKMLFVFAPGKGTFYKEYIPDRYFVKGKNPVTNYSMLKGACITKQINHIDFNSWFLELKGKTKHPLFPKAGIHWSYYGMYLCADSLTRKAEIDLGKDIPEIILSNIEVSKEQRNPEYDLGDLTNLLFPIKTYELAYPTFTYNTSGKYRPKVLVIGDSFYWNIYYSGIPANVFNSLEFWYYNNKYYNDGTATEKSDISSMDYFSELMKYEYIIILQTDGGLNNFGFGFFDNCINAFSKNNDIPEEVLNYMESMRNDPKWMRSIEEKAKQRDISVEEMLKQDAYYIYEQSKN